MIGKILLLFLGVAFSVIAHSDHAEPEVVVLEFENKSNETGKYSVTYKLSNGIIHFESGSLGSEVAEGSYWFVGPDNVTYSIDYYVDSDGFHGLIGSGAGVNFKVLASSVG